MRTDDPSPWRLPDADPAVVHDLGVGCEPHLPTRVADASGPVDPLPVEEVGLVLETDLGDRVPTNQVAGFVSTTDAPLLVVRPAVPPEATPALSPQPLDLATEQRVAQRREIAGRNVQFAVGMTEAG